MTCQACVSVAGLHVRLVFRTVGVIEDDGTVTPVTEAESILSTDETCGECRKPWPCPTVKAMHGNAPSEGSS